MGATHAAVGAYLASLWGLPHTLVEALAYHHDPAIATTPGFCALTAVHAANALDHEVRLPVDSIEARLDEEYLGRLGLGGLVNDWRQFRDRDGAA